MSDPICFVDDLVKFDQESVAKIMGGNLAKLMKVENTRVI